MQRYENWTDVIYCVGLSGDSGNNTVDIFDIKGDL